MKPTDAAATHCAFRADLKLLFCSIWRPRSRRSPRGSPRMAQLFGAIMRLAANIHSAVTQAG
jgi:hypothetical protein